MNTDCCAEHNNPGLLSVEQATIKIRDAIKPLTDQIEVAIQDSLGQVLACDVCSAIDIPTASNSAMDGYALKYEDIQPDCALTVTGTAFAGHPFSGKVEAGQSVRIMTGAVIPDGADCVIMQEQITREQDQITISGQHEPDENIRKAGEDVVAGQTVITKGTLITPSHVALIATLGVAKVNVFRKIRVAFFSTGDELQSLGTDLSLGQIYDSNRYALTALLQSPRIEMIDLGIIPDDKALIEGAFLKAANTADLVLTSGGVSVGDADYVKEILDKLGKINFWRIAMKPGKPLAFGFINDCTFFGLPGNPVSSIVTFYQFVIPALRKLSGQAGHPVHHFKAPVVCDLKKAPGRAEFQRGFLHQNDLGQTVVDTTGKQGSHLMTSMAQANCFIVLAKDSDGAKAGDLVDVQPLYGLF
jgi:molybdopterin molybdotransferase